MIYCNNANFEEFSKRGKISVLNALATTKASRIIGLQNVITKEGVDVDKVQTIISILAGKQVSQHTTYNYLHFMVIIGLIIYRIPNSISLFRERSCTFTILTNLMMMMMMMMMMMNNKCIFNLLHNISY